MALGAQPRSVYRLILREALWLTGFGIVIGLVCSVAAATLIRGLPFGVRSQNIDNAEYRRSCRFVSAARSRTARPAARLAESAAGWPAHCRPPRASARRRW
ncbi:MAG: hypothetical protein ABSF62_12175 [Bryobacteraceae bacterium]